MVIPAAAGGRKYMEKEQIHRIVQLPAKGTFFT